jgi:glycosyltransferase involved in cell wall biosynthesis
MGLAKLLGKRIVLKMTLIGGDDATALSGRPAGVIRRLNFRIADKIISISRPMSDRYRESGQDDSKLVEMPQGVDLERFRPASASEKQVLRENLTLPVEGQILVFVGALLQRKGADILVDAFYELSRNRPKLQLVIIGEHDYGSIADTRSDRYRFWRDLQERIRLRGLGGRIHFVGVVENVDAYMRAADIMVFPSRREGFGTVIIEAMAAGLPTVTGSIGGIARTTVNTGVDGIIVESENPSDYAMQIARLLDGPSKAAEIGSAARRCAESRYSFAKVADEYLVLYRELLGLHPPAINRFFERQP